jgi:hypothetical protein
VKARPVNFTWIPLNCFALEIPITQSLASIKVVITIWDRVLFCNTSILIYTDITELLVFSNWLIRWWWNRISWLCRIWFSWICRSWVWLRFDTRIPISGTPIILDTFVVIHIEVALLLTNAISIWETSNKVQASYPAGCTLLIASFIALLYARIPTLLTDVLDTATVRLALVGVFRTAALLIIR